MGITLFELLTGEVPYTGGTVQFILVQHLTNSPPRLADIAADLPQIEALQRLLDMCLAKEPDARIRTAKLLAEEVNQVLQLLGDEPSGGDIKPRNVPIKSAAQSVATAEPRSRSLVWLWITVAAVVFAALVWWLLRQY
jgi:serine/threonine protein kinase